MRALKPTSRGATVNLQPLDLKKGAAAFGETGADGVAKLRTSWAQGAVPGKYKGTVIKTDAPVVAAPPPPVDPKDMAAKTKMYMQGYAQKTKTGAPAAQPKDFDPEEV